MFGFLGGFPWINTFGKRSYGYFLSGIILGVFSVGNYPWDTSFRRILLLGIILWLLSSGVYPWVNSFGELSLEFFLSGIILGGTFFFASYKGGWGPREGLHYGGRWIMTACSDSPQQISLSLYSLTREGHMRALHTKCMRGLVMRGGEGKGRLDYCRQLLHCLKGWDLSTAGTGRGECS